jgi:hypothetical protein
MAVYKPSFVASSRGPPNPVKVLSKLSRHVIVYYRFYTFDIQPTGSQVGGHQKVNSAIAEPLERS